MPIYEYQCQACGHQFERMQKMSDEPIKVCPVCEKEAVSKLISAPSFQLKGNGWYVTDFRGQNSDAKTTSSDTSTSSSKTDAAPQSAKPSSNTDAAGSTSSD